MIVSTPGCTPTGGNRCKAVVWLAPLNDRKGRAADSGHQCRVIGQNSHWAWLAATTALLLPAVARSVNLPSVSFLRTRTGALDPEAASTGPIWLPRSGRSGLATVHTYWRSVLRPRGRTDVALRRNLSADHKDVFAIAGRSRGQGGSPSGARPRYPGAPTPPSPVDAVNLGRCGVTCLNTRRADPTGLHGRH